jgi:5-methylcytosine-specific restriction enzyme B
MAHNTFGWIPFYESLATKLAGYELRQTELIAYLEGLRAQGLAITPLNDRNASGERFLVTEIDPFTFIGVGNRGVTNEKRIRIFAEFAKFFGIGEPVPTAFAGLPIMNNQNSWIMPWQADRERTDIETLWEVFRLALGPDPLSNAAFGAAFDRALRIHNVNFNLTIGLFWARPRTFLALDRNTRQFLKVQVPRDGLSFSFYAPLVKQVVLQHPEGIPQLSQDAWLSTREESPQPPVTEQESLGNHSQTSTSGQSDINYWMVGAWWQDRDPQDQTERFIEKGIWENGYTDHYLDEVRAMRPGDRIAIKAAGTQRRNLPFDNRGRTASRIIVRATGTVLKNLGDGRRVEVEWDKRGTDRAWYFYTNRGTVWRLNPTEPAAQQLIRFAFDGEKQDYAYFLGEGNGSGESDNEGRAGGVGPKPYSIDDAVAEGVFLETDTLEEILRRLNAKQNLILQGAPGVGKTYLARKLAYALMEELDDRRIWSVQFHPSYSYEDFVRGFRPGVNPGAFDLVDGPLLHICAAAKTNPDLAFVMLIDEVNRGNTSQIFGELLALMEADKRGPSHGVTPIYRREPTETLWIPENVYFIGTMNLADRSLALVDYALRRRFAFVTLEPQFASAAYREWHLKREMPARLLDRIIDRMTQLNMAIAADSRLGPNYRIGHSFFCPRGQDFSGLDDRWFRDVAETEVIPLLQEYWFDSRDVAEAEAKRLLEP